MEANNRCEGRYEYFMEADGSTEQEPISIYKCNVCGHQYTRYHPNRKPEQCQTAIAMKNEEINIYKVLFSARLSPTPEVSMKTFKAKATERGNSYLVTGIEFKSGDMEELTNNKTIPKTNLMVTSGFGNTDSISQSLWCLEGQISEAKEICMDKMQSLLRRNLRPSYAHEHNISGISARIKKN